MADAAQAVLVRESASAPSQIIESIEAKRLYGQALHAYWTRRNPSEAFDLQLKAFGADPRDPEIAGNLAFLYLKVNPVQPEAARLLALHAIAVRGTRFRTGRLEDWNTYAIASALTGRDADAEERTVRRPCARKECRMELQGSTNRDRKLRRAASGAGRRHAVSHPRTGTSVRVALLHVAAEFGGRCALSVRCAVPISTSSVRRLNAPPTR